MGFDEVAFSYLQQPLAATELKYASQSGTPSRTDAVVSLAKYLRVNLTATGLRVSAIAADSSFDAATRFVPFLTQAPESGSYVTTG